MSEPEGGNYWALLSGGKDSVCAAHVLASKGKLSGCVFLDTGVGCPDTLPFVQKLCRDQGWNLRTFKAPKSFEEIVAIYGFPHGNSGHRWAFGWLKERPLREARKQLGPSTIFASGARRKESARRSQSFRMGLHSRIRFENVIADWSTAQTWKYLREHDLPVSPSYLSIGRSGDCNCGAFSHWGEAETIRRSYPDLAARMERLENAVADLHPYPRNRWGGRAKSIGGFKALRGRLTIEEAICGGDCASAAEPPP
jgi:3'-phosphoadenosine 5'-phosphosulfate sulfotransferase (PAPS reductase)/FAD synthetase